MKAVYPILWVLWIVSFLVIEGSALITHHNQYTLSDYVWRLEEINAGWTFLRFFICAFCLWLLCHMAFGWFK